MAETQEHEWISEEAYEAMVAEQLEPKTPSRYGKTKLVAQATVELLCAPEPSRQGIYAHSERGARILFDLCLDLLRERFKEEELNIIDNGMERQIQVMGKTSGGWFDRSLSVINSRRQEELVRAIETGPTLRG